MTETQTRTKNRTKTKLVLDVLIFIAFLIAMEPRSSGITIYEWLATSLIVVLVVHLLLSWDWITQITRRFIRKINNQSRLNYILNWSLFIDGTVIMLSGFMISESLMPYLGIQLPRNFAWRGLHEFSTNLFILLLGLRTALHWGWVVDMFKHYVFQPIFRPPRPACTTNSREREREGKLPQNLLKMFNNRSHQSTVSGWRA